MISQQRDGMFMLCITKVLITNDSIWLYFFQLETILFSKSDIFERYIWCNAQYVYVFHFFYLHRACFV